MGNAALSGLASRKVFALTLWVLAAWSCLWPLVAAADEKAPRRIVSLNVCTDQLLMMLVPRERIAAVSYLASSKETSAMAQEARDLPFTYGNAEHVLLLKPDLVLAGSYTSRATVSLLRKLGFNILELKPAAGFEQIFENIRIVGNAVGEDARARSLVQRMEHDLLELRTTRERPRAALYGANSYTSGKGALIESVLYRAGFNSLANEIGIRGTQKISLETLITGEPDALIMGHRLYAGDALAYAAFDHPALRHISRNTPTFSLADAMTICGTPHAAKAVQKIRQFREEITKNAEKSQ